MRFIVTGEWTKNHLLKLIIFFFLLYIFVLWLTAALLYFNKMGLDYQSVVEYYLGSEAKFTQPRSYQGLLEISHAHFFSMGILILTMTHLLLFVPMRMPIKVFLILVSFLSAFLDEASGWLIRYVHPLFAYLKITSFVTLELSLVVIMLVVGKALWTNQPSAYAERGKKTD